MKLLRWLPALSLALGALAKEEPKISYKKFDAPPHNLFFFDDSEVAIVVDRDGGIVYRSTDAGTEWKPVEDLTKGEPYAVVRHPYDSEVAVALGKRKRHWITQDQGESWRSFETEENPSLTEPLSFHATDSDRILFHGDEYCDFFTCLGATWYTEDGFKSHELLQGKRKLCIWGKTYELFTTGDEKRDDKLTLCITESRTSHLTRDYRLVMSDDFFKDNAVEPKMTDGRTIAGMTNMAAVKGFLVAAAKSQGTSELALYVTKDANTWHRAEFGNHKVEEDAYTILESTNYSIQVDVQTTPRAHIGTLFTSNSNGTYFAQNVEHTNRNKYGIVDFEKIQNIQGIVLVNTVENWEEIQHRPRGDKKVRSKISFDDGRTFHDLRVGDDSVHLHSMTEQHNSGRVFSSPAPGIVMGVGNTGDHLRKYTDGDLYVSEDAGVTWLKALKEAHIYEFGDNGSILVAVYDEGPVDQIMYSIDHGRSWTSAKLEHKIRAYELTTIPDSTSLKFVLIGAKGEGRATEHYIIALDFGGLHERQCGSGDFEKWYARKDDKGEPVCIMGHKQWFNRRKADADCFINEEFKDPVPETEQCECTEEDFECDGNFIRSEDRKACIPAGPLTPPPGECKTQEGKFKGSSGWRLIPGNDCKRKAGAQKDDPIERQCSDTVNKPASGKISSEITQFRGKRFEEYYYLERGPSGDDETIVMATDRRHAYITHDHGKTWDVAIKDEVVAIYPHQYFNDHVYFITSTDKVYYSQDRGFKIHSFKAPEAPNRDGLQILSFHEKEANWLLWTGGKDCKGGSENCHTVAHVSTKGGEDWTTLMRYVQKCQFIYRIEGRQVPEELIYCEQFEGEDIKSPMQLISSEDFFEHKEVHFKDVVNFATMSEFLIVAARSQPDRKWLKVDASIDGKNFASAQFPHNFPVHHQQAYTVLDSSTNSIFMHVTTNNVREQEYGTILKSNSNGTSYVLSISAVNRNTHGFVDFEKMQGLEGVAVINVVENAKEVDGGARKKLRTMITHNDGAEWALLPPPKKDAAGGSYDCTSAGVEQCSLNLHGYTERKDPRDTYSSASAVGLMLGIGNVGDHLSSRNEADTFMTTDGGITWNVIAKGVHQWEYGDQGSIVVIVKDETPTREVMYTLDEGRSWDSYVFAEMDMTITDISTVPSDNSRNFLLWGKDHDGKLVTVNIDFTGLTDQPCNLDEENPEAEDSDYYLWRPKHPLQENDCLFGHVAEYHRKKLDSKCYNGPMIHKLHSIAKNCSCTRQDFECDYNFERAKDGSCQLVEGLDPLDPMAVCSAEGKNAIEWFDVTGYRRIPISTCEGGNDLASIKPHPCPGHEEEYQKKRGISGLGLFFAVVIPIGAAAGVGYWVWSNWGGKFGRIRLGDSSSGMGGDSPFVRYPVAAISGLVAVLAALPLLASSLWRSISSRFGGGYGGRTYTSRSSFARGRGDYAVVDPDEGELLGEDSDEEV